MTTPASSHVTLCTTLDNVTGAMCNLSATQGQMPQRPQNNNALIETIVTTTVIGIGMIGIGCSVNYKVLWYYIKRPKAYLLGVMLQLLLVPLIAWGLAKAFQLPEAEKVGVMIQGTCPGGTTSNIVVYWMGGVVDLSVAMTATSTLLSLGTMPLWLFIFSTAEGISGDLLIPFRDLGIALASMIVPLVIGILLNAKFPKKAYIISKVLITGASLFILGWLIYSSVQKADLWRIVWQQIVIALLMPFIIFILGYLVTIIPGIRLNGRCRKTVAVECALQNVQVASAVTTLSFARNPFYQIRMVAFYLMYYAVQVVYALLLCIFYRIAVKQGWAKDTMGGQDGGNTDTEKDEAKNKVGNFNPTYENDISVEKPPRDGDYEYSDDL